jgi:DNA-binding CsgD family transcriptional regulator/AcrR family transcriptional regulator
MRSGPSSPDDQSPKAADGGDRLLAQVSDSRYAARVAAIAACIPAAADQPAVHALFREGVAALGAERAAFVSFVRDDTTLSSCRFMIDCDPAWGRMYLDDGHFVHDPWLAYAAHHSEPVLADELEVVDPLQRRVIDLAVRAGFVSALLVPAHSGAGHSRISALCLGAAAPGYFDSPTLPTVRVSARMLAMELHDWWLARLRCSLVVRARLSHDDLVLLRHQLQGHSSKRIAAELQVSKGSVDCRFQRMNAKLGVPNRRMAVKLAIECGLILG